MWGAEETYSATTGPAFSGGSNFTLVADKNSGNAPVYNSTEKGVRLYCGSYLSITPKNGETISAVSMTVKCNTGGKNNVYPTGVSANTGTITAGSTPGNSVSSITWEGNTTSALTFTVAGTAGNVSVKTVTITYTASASKADNAISVTGGTTRDIALTGGSAVSSFNLGAITSAEYGTPTFAVKSATNLVEDTDFSLADGVISFTNTYKGIIVVTASVAEGDTYKSASQDITINCSGDLRSPAYSFNDTEELAKGNTIIVANGTNITSDGAITLSTTNDAVASVNNTTKAITGVEKGSCSITIATAEGTYYASGSKTFTLNVINPKGSAENPYTVAEAKAAIDASGTTEDVYVKGIVCTGGSDLNSGRLIYWISDDGTTTNRFEIYRGYGLNGASFTNNSDIQVGDKVTVMGDILLYNSTTYEFSAGSQITSFFRKAVSDLAITSSSPVALEMTTAQPNPTSTITWTTSSTGAMSFVSNNTSVATVSDAGVITAVGSGSTTITISQATDDDYKASENKTVTVNVTDNRDAAATGIDLSSAKTIVKGSSAAISATSTKAAGFTGEITYSYESADPTIFSIATGNYTGAGVGATTVTVTATPTGGNANLYKAASQEVAVTVNGTNSISLDKTKKTQAKSAGAFNITATVPTENYNGTVSAESSNESVATVAVEGTTITVTPVSVGTATITVTAGTDTYYLTTASETCDVEFTAPEASDKAEDGIAFRETFSGCNGTGGNSGGWSGTIASTTYSNSKADDSHAWTMQNPYAADKCVRMGKANGLGIATTPSLELKAGITYTLTFRAGAWSGKNTNLKISMTNGTLSANNVTMKDGAFDNFELTITNASNNATISFEGNSSSDSQFFLDDVVVSYDPSASVNIPASGYATYCSEYPLDLTDAENYKAFYVSAIDGTNITLTKINAKVKGGTPFILYGKKSTTVSIPMADSNNTLGSNKLVGTMEDTYVTNIVGDNTIFGMYQGEFRKINTGVIPAHKAYLPIPTANITPGSRISMVFEDETTGINDVRSEMDEVNGEVYNLNGQRVKNPGKGLYIVNGKKVIMK